MVIWLHFFFKLTCTERLLGESDVVLSILLILIIMGFLYDMSITAIYSISRDVKKFYEFDNYIDDDKVRIIEMQ